MAQKRKKSNADIFEQAHRLMFYPGNRPEGARRDKIADIFYRYTDNIEAAHKRFNTKVTRRVYAGY